ncbi:MAG: hypothetical protein KC431_08435, partial [Myxococcales bacterium]|nr:hypothetical protein [Myxococcales bacterium]
MSGSDESRDADQPAGRAARANQKRDEPRKNRRSAGHVRSASRMLAREATKILGRHRARIPAVVVTEIEAAVAAIEALRAKKPNEDLVELEYQAEHLDELLH